MLKLSSCHAVSLKGNALVVSRELNLTGTIFSESLSFIGADIAGQLDMSGAQLYGADQYGYSLVADGIKVGGSVFLRSAGEQDPFTAAGAIELEGADIAGQLDMSGAQLYGADPYGYPLVADGIKVGGSVFLRSAGEQIPSLLQAP